MTLNIRTIDLMLVMGFVISTYYRRVKVDGIPRSFSQILVCRNRLLMVPSVSVFSVFWYSSQEETSTLEVTLVSKVSG